MARETEKDRVRRWTDRLKAADDAYTAWSDKYHCQTLEQYYEGQQWAGLSEDEAKDKYTINLIFPTIETQLPALLYYRPKFLVEPRPPHADDAGATSPDRAKLAEDTLQTFVDDKATQFKLQTMLALRDANFRFGVVEVGYSADWIDNPAAQKPALPEKDVEQGASDEPVPTKVPRPGSERIFVKYIPAKDFRVSQSGKNALTANDWVGYKEWHYLSDVQANPKYRNTSRLRASGTLREGVKATDDADAAKHKDMVCVWKLWDLRTRTKIVLAERHEKFLLEEEYAYLPFAVIKHFERLNEFYPLPPVYNWLSPQDEINETRDSRKIHRKRFYRRYTMMKGAMDPSEREKLETGGDGVIAERNTPDDTLKPVQDAPLGGDTDKHLIESRDDFMQITGVGAEARGQAEADTATQANIIEGRAQLRESSSRMLVAEWLSEIGRLMLRCLIDKMQLPFWIQIHTDPFAGDQEEALRTAQTVQQWKEISASDVGESAAAFDVTVDVTSLSPVAEQQKLMAWNQVLALLANPSMLMILMQSEALLRKTLKFYGITADKEIREIQRVGQGIMAMQLAAQASAAMAGATSTAKPSAGVSALPGASQPPAGVPQAPRVQ